MHGMKLAASRCYSASHVPNVRLMDQFSSDSVAAIERKLDVEIEKRNSGEDISSYYELSRCSEWIKQGRFNKVPA